MYICKRKKNNMGEMLEKVKEHLEKTPKDVLDKEFDEVIFKCYGLTREEYENSLKHNNNVFDDLTMNIINEIVKSGNEDILDNVIVYLFEPLNYPYYGESLLRYKDNEHSKFKAVGLTVDSNSPDYIEGYYVTTTLKTILDNGWQDDIDYLCRPTELHEIL